MKFFKDMFVKPDGDIDYNHTSPEDAPITDDMLAQFAVQVARLADIVTTHHKAIQGINDGMEKVCTTMNANALNLKKAYELNRERIDMLEATVKGFTVVPKGSLLS